MEKRRYRTDNPPAWGGKWVIRYYDPSMDLWFDHEADVPFDTRIQADVKLDELLNKRRFVCGFCGADIDPAEPDGWAHRPPWGEHEEPIQPVQRVRG